MRPSRARPGRAAASAVIAPAEVMAGTAAGVTGEAGSAVIGESGPR
jgi:hypothetical protein